MTLANRLRQSLRGAIVGKDDVLDRVILSLLCGGHILLEDIPGTGKTTLAKAIAQSIGGESKRVQFTPDLLPSDLSGISFFNQKTQEFSFHKGAIFTQILLADEINRTTPRTQSSLLECMEEGQVTVDGVTHELPKPFFVIATQNPVETQGVYPLPEAQLDRFLLCLELGYPKREDERAILRGASRSVREAVCTPEEILSERERIAGITVSEPVEEYILNLAERSRNDKDITLGLSTRGAMALQTAARGYAHLQGRRFVLPDDVKAIAPDVIAHRILVKGSGLLQSRDYKKSIVECLLEETPVPMEESC